MGNNVKIFVLTWVFGTRVVEIKRSPSIQVIQLKKKELKNQPQYKKGFFEVRTSEGLKVKPILNEKEKIA